MATILLVGGVILISALGGIAILVAGTAVQHKIESRRAVAGIDEEYRELCGKSSF